MPFNIALSGLKAASGDLKITGNNIANASTVGFKESRAEFADVYSSSLLGGGSAAVGSGVKLSNVAQQFEQGTIGFTSNSLDVAIDGQGFFVLDDGGSRTYTRAGMFGLDQDGFITANSGARLQGFTANDTGTLNGVISDIVIQTGNLAPNQTTQVETDVNLDAESEVLAQFGTTINTLGQQIGQAQAGVGVDIPSVVNTLAVPTPFDFSIDTNSVISASNASSSSLPFDFSAAASTSFGVSLSGGADAAGNLTQTVTLDSSITTLQDLIADIRDDLQASAIGVDVREDPANPGRLQFYATVSGEASVIDIGPTGTLTLGTGVSQAQLESVLGGIAMTASTTNPNPTVGTTTAALGSLTSATFDVALDGASVNNGGPVTVTLDTDIQDLDDLINDIRDDLRVANIGVDVREDPDNVGRLQFYATTAGEASNITINNFITTNPGVTTANLAATLNVSSGVTIPGIAAVDNAYLSQSIDIVDASGREVVTNTVTTLEGETAAQIAARFNNIPGVSASASTSATLAAADYVNNSGAMALTINSVEFTSATLADLADDINASDSLGGISAELDVDTGDLNITNALGTDLRFSISSLDTTDSLSVQGPTGASVQLDLIGGDTAAAVGGSLNLILAEGVTLASPNPAQSGLFGGIAETDFDPFTINQFDPINQDTYNSATSVTLFDSLGNPHVMTQYFVKEPFAEGDVTALANRWTMYVQIDGEDVGDPDVSLLPPLNTLPTMASFNLQFDEFGQLLPFESDTVHISNWTPLDINGDFAGALGPVNILEGAVLPIPDPAISSNFVIDLGDSTQFGSNFAVNQVNQNGFTTGRLNGLDIADDGTIFARYTNGENQVLAQLVLANFANNQGLTSLGSTSWAESFESGEPVIGVAGSASLGGISSGALEDSNVELSDELVQLIIAQRNFQANAKTIQTADAVTQTIINLR
ncbi:MAG: flagellar hook protein FlgE [Cyclobacteriaceae bacterium]|jgi:flagellar hook protein FlgE